MPTFFDTHAHLDSEQFSDPATIVARASAAGVTRMVAVATTAASTIACQQLATQFHGVYASAGIHPNHTHEAAPSDWDVVVQHAELPRVVAIGETGLDLFHQFAPLTLQQEYFDRHLRLSQQMQKPFITHVRDCTSEVMTMLRTAAARGPLTGILHSFTGDADMARECVELGLHISFAGMVTFKKSDDLRAVAAIVPSDRLLIETDSPYLSPHPYRDQRPNEPALVVHTAQCLAEVRGVSLADIAEVTTANACRLFGIV